VCAGTAFHLPPEHRMSELVYQDPRRPIADRVTDLIERMTLTEKVGQLTSVWLTVDPDRGEVAPAQFAAMFGEMADLDELLASGIGQITRPLGTAPIDPKAGATQINALQRRLVEGTRLGIPAICHEECLTGLMAQGATSFPSPLNFGSTWDPDLIERVAAVIRRQMLAVGARQGLAPVADVARDARWGRIEETIGEDPYLVGVMVSAYVRGLQGDDPTVGVIATLKHFAGYSFSEGGRNFGPTHVGPREMADVFLLPFEMAVKTAGARSVMNAYQEVDGEHPAASRHLLTDVLRDQWGFDGFVVADYGAVSFLHLFDGVAADSVEAAAMALRAGLDVELPAPAAYPFGLPAALDRELITMADIDLAVSRVLTAKFQLGLFEIPYVDAEAVALDLSDERELAGEVARRSITLLANDGTLPLDAASVGSVAVIGPNAHDVMALFGNYSFENHLVSTHYREAAGVIEAPTVLDVLRTRIGVDRVGYARGCNVMGDDRSNLSAAVEAARCADVAIVVLGDKAGHFKLGTVGEGTDTVDLSLPGVQGELLTAIAATGTPTIVVLLNGRPFALGAHVDRVAAIVEAWFPGQDGAGAVVDVLLGDANPAGKTTVSFARSAGAMPQFYNHKPLAPGFPQQDDFGFVFPFGHGLSYTRFDYADLVVEPSRVAVDGAFAVSCVVSNVGDRAGDEIVQLYVRDPVASVTRPVLELKAFRRLPLAPGEAARVEFELHADLLGFTGVDLERIVEPGSVEIRVGSSSADVRLEGSVTLIGATRRVGEDRRLLAATRVTSLER
jgi:beta-glucosidase-like glycosyl hydrolase